MYKSSYVPKSLSKEDKKKQVKSIKEQTKRPKLKSFESKRSPFAKRFEDKYGYKITEKSKISKDLLSMTGIKQVINKGVAAYYNSGSRPNQTPASWSNARLASVLLFGAAARIDKDILLKYGKGDILKKAKEKFEIKSHKQKQKENAKRDVEDIPLDKLKEHSKLHKGGMKSMHIKNMIKFMKEGNSFDEAHKKAKKEDLKK